MNVFCLVRPTRRFETGAAAGPNAQRSPRRTGRLNTGADVMRVGMSQSHDAIGSPELVGPAPLQPQAARPGVFGAWWPRVTTSNTYTP